MIRVGRAVAKVTVTNPRARKAEARVGPGKEAMAQLSTAKRTKKIRSGPGATSCKSVLDKKTSSVYIFKMLSGACRHHMILSEYPHPVNLVNEMCNNVDHSSSQMY